MLTLARDGVKHTEIARRLDRPIGSVSRIISDAILEGHLEHRYQRDNKRTTRSYDYTRPR